MTAMLSCLTQQQELLRSLADRVGQRATQDDLYFCLAGQFTWVEDWYSTAIAGEILILDAGEKQQLSRVLQQWEQFTGQVILITGLTEEPDPQAFLAQLASVKQQRCGEKHFHWVVLVPPAIEEAFRGLQTFLDGKSHWLDLRLGAGDLEQCTDELWQWIWREPSPFAPEQRQQMRANLSPWLAEIVDQKKNLELEPISILQAKLSLLQGFARESQGEVGRKQARCHYQESLDVWQLLGDGEPIIWLSLRLAYLYLLQAYGEKSRGHQLWQQTRHYVATAIAVLENQQWRFANGEILKVAGEVLRGLEDWEQMRQMAENCLIFFYQLSPFAATDTTPERNEDKPWTELELQGLISLAYGYLCEALVEQWKFDEAKEALKRAFETRPKQAETQDYRPCLANLHYLSGRVQLANDQIKEALITLRQAQTLVSFDDDPRLSLAILVELRECYLQLQDWLGALAIDQEYQGREYRLGERVFIGPTPLPCWPEQRLCRHPLAPEKILGGTVPTPKAPEIKTNISSTWHGLQQVWTQKPMPVLVLTGEPGGGKTSWLAGEVMQQMSPERVIRLEFSPSWAEKLWAHLGERFSLPSLGQVTAPALLSTLEALPPLDLLLILDGDNGTLPWQQNLSLRRQELARALWQWLLTMAPSQGVRLLISLPPTAIADLYTELKGQLGEEQSLPPLQYQTIPPLTLGQAEAWLAQAMAQSRHPWPPSLQSQFLGDLAIDAGWEQEPWLHPIDLQLLGTVLEQQQITKSADYQGKKTDEWLTLAIQTYLAFLPPNLLKKALQLLKNLADGEQTLCLKTVDQLLIALYVPDSSEGETSPQFAQGDIQELQLLLVLLCRGRLVSVIYQGTVAYYRLSTPHLAHALRGKAIVLPSSALLSAGCRGSKSNPNALPPSPGDRQQENEDLVAALEAGPSAEEQVTAQKLKAAQLQYQKLVAGINLEKKCQFIFKQFVSYPLEALLAAVKTGQELQKLITPETSLVEYPSLAPWLCLHSILGQINEHNRCQHEAPVTGLRISPPIANAPPLLLTATNNGLAYLWSFHGELIAVLRGHQGAITAVDWSADGQYFATASVDRTVKLWQRHGQEIATLQGHEDGVRSVHFSPHHQFLITGSRDNTVRLWNFAGEQLTLCQGHTNWVRNAEFNCHGQILLSASRDGTARLWDLEGREIGLCQGHTSWVRNAQFSPDGQWILTGSADGTARIWDLGAQCVAVLRGHQNWVTNALWSPDGQHIITASNDGTARIWSAQGKCLAILRGHDHSIHSARFSSDGERVITCSTDGTARLWTHGGSVITILRGHQKDIYDADFSADGRYIFTVSADQTARQWDIAPKNIIVLSGHRHWVRNAHFSSKGDRLLTVSRDKTARLWTMDGECLAILADHQGWVREGQFSPDGQWVVTGSADKTAQLWNVFGKKLTTLRGHQDAVLNVRFSPDSQYIVTASKDGTARVWNNTGRELAVLRHYEKNIFAAEFSADGQFIVTAADDNTAGIWEIVGREVGLCRGHEGPVYFAQFSPDSRYVLTASVDNTARIWDFLGRPLVTLAGHQSIVYQAQFSPDGDLIATASADHTARLWDRNGKTVAVLYGHQSLVSTVNWSPDGQMVVTASNDGTARLWDRSGRELMTLEGHGNWVRSAEFSPDGNWVLTASADGTARLWPLKTLPQLLDQGRQWLKDYLTHNALVATADRPNPNVI
ncbi:MULTISPECIES: WD40 repeat domain-containing protein [unclassified Synechocystis]|uniref:WD40 repeat domain-containing protein n=1 Tax=unclassified Synechocystis TaxID=2640012 RepID=UPI000412CD4C|nr:MULTISPECIES: WD40 repeat domain-containing protein [unclassified Synechocystis]AIE75005.1 High-affnity carbon uptake protein Hat/HatR [Synechocystis sp. PCC 6714]MCT0253288.1 WD40 repeat domain-containing protein [Synechocystis sp. CS-94]